MRTTIRGLAIMLAAGVTTACGGYMSRSELLLQDDHIEAATIAARTVAEGISDYRSGQQTPAICVGTTKPNTQNAEFQRVLTQRLQGTAPVVVDATECERTSDTGWRVRDGELTAVNLVPQPVRWDTGDRGTTGATVTFDQRRMFTYDIVVGQLNGPWYVDDVYCNPGPSRVCVPIDPEVAGR